jgi:hypothetical protein
MASAEVTPTNLRGFNRWLVEQCRLKPSRVNRNLGTLNRLLTWAVVAARNTGASSVDQTDAVAVLLALARTMA